MQLSSFLEDIASASLPLFPCRKDVLTIHRAQGISRNGTGHDCIKSTYWSAHNDAMWRQSSHKTFPATSPKLNLLVQSDLWPVTSTLVRSIILIDSEFGLPANFKDCGIVELGQHFRKWPDARWHKVIN